MLSLAKLARGYLRGPGYMNADMGLSKTFDMPWTEKQKLQLRWDVFNVANYQPFGTVDTSRSGFGVVRDPQLRNLTPPSNWANLRPSKADRGRCRLHCGIPSSRFLKTLYQRAPGFCDN